MTLLKKLFGKKDLLSEHADVERCASCGRTKIKGSNLEFLSRINRDGSGTMPITESMEFLSETIFVITCLSISNKTYIASEFNSFVVKIKQ